ncbi:MAG: hypothetical protein Q4A71_01205 [Actinomycetaceae bacterium]|nr:hypothetical protein [Actinomycetaceae bacterium]
MPFELISRATAPVGNLALGQVLAWVVAVGRCKLRTAGEIG